MAAAADDEDWGSASFGMSAAAPAPAPAPAADDGDDEFSVSIGMDPAVGWMVRHDASPNGGGSLFACLLVCLYRMCRRNGTLQAFATTPELATTRASGEFDLNTLYFNLSARERTRLREYANGVRRDRRMPTILARHLIISKVDKRKLHGQLRRLVYGLFMTESDELFRVVVSFL